MLHPCRTAQYEQPVHKNDFECIYCDIPFDGYIFHNT